MKQKRSMNKSQDPTASGERGISLYIAFMVMTALLGIALGTSALLLSELGFLKGMGDSVIAFFATDAGIERALYIDNGTCATAGGEGQGQGEGQQQQTRQECLESEFASIGASPPQSVSLSNGASYQLLAENGGEGGCPSGKEYCIKAIGIFQEVRRAVRVAR